MNNPRRRTAAASLPSPLVPAALGVAGLTLGACSNPLKTLPSDYGDPVPTARLLEVEPIELTERAPDADESASIPVPYADNDRLELALDQARAWTLENNLDLRVALINPTAAGASLREQEAAWQAVFSVDARWNNTDQPTSSNLAGAQTDIRTLTPQIRVPLRTGGNVDFRTPVSRTATNNQFSTLSPAFTTDFEVSISQPLLRGGGREANTHALRVAAYQEGIELARTKLEVIRQLANADRAYWRLFAVHRALDVARQQHTLAMTQYDRAKRLYDSGRTAEIEVIRAEEGVANRLENIIKANNDVKREQRTLKRVMNAPQLSLEELPVLWPSTDPTPVPLDLNAGRLTTIAMGQRMELLELELQLAVDASTVALRQNEQLPDFTLDYTYRVNGLGERYAASTDVLTDGNFEDWSVGLRYESPFGNDAAKSRTARAVIDRLQRLSTRDARRQSIEEEVRNAVDAIDAGWQRILAARQSALLAGRTLEAEQRQFSVGRSTTVNVLDAATRLADAQLAEIRALTEYQIAQVDLAFATGSVLGSALVEWDAFDPRTGSAVSNSGAQ